MRRRRSSVGKSRSYSLRRIAWLGLSVIPLCSCVSEGVLDAPKLSRVEQEEVLEESGADMLLDLVDDRVRLINVEYRLAKVLASKCGAMSRPHPGVLIANESSFQETVPRASMGINWGSDYMTIMHLVPGGSFDRAGLRRGDLLVALDGQLIRSGADLTKFMLASETRRSVHARFVRGDSLPTDAWVPLDHTCPIRVGLGTSSAIIPLQSERLLITVPRGLMRYAKDDSTLAIPVAHQIAHALFDQPDDDAIASEKRADRLGLKLAAAAGYDVRGAAAYWEDVAIEYPTTIGEAGPHWRPLSWDQGSRIYVNSIPHPEIAQRMQAIREISAEVGGE